MPKVTTVLFGDLAIIPYPAQAPCSETLSFFTEVQTAYQGLENRHKLRALPRSSFSYSIPLAAWRTMGVFNTLVGALRQKWAVPVWTEPQYVGTVLASATSIACDTLLHDLRANSLALLYYGCGSWQIVEIGTITATTVQVTNSLTFASNAYLIPVRIGYIEQDATNQTNGYNGSVQLNYEIEDLVAITGTTPEQYLGDDIYYTAPFIEGFSSRSLTQAFDKPDNDTGVIGRYSMWAKAKYNYPFATTLTTPDEVKTFKAFFHRCAGKYKQFWQPLFETAFRIIDTGLVTTTLTVENDSYYDYPIRNHITILRSNGTNYNRIISNPTLVALGRVQLTLDTSLGFNVSEIISISYLGLVRLSVDDVTLNWIGNGVAQVAFNEVEINA